jgi:REP element-mobilizing transposase RayT
MELNEYGRILTEEWQTSSTIRLEIELDKFVIMPNHIHGIVTIQDVGANGRSPETGRSAESPLRMKQKSISSFIAGFKSVVTKSINNIRSTPDTPSGNGTIVNTSYGMMRNWIASVHTS